MTGDEVYGTGPALAAELRRRGVGFTAARWQVEESFQLSKDRVGLDHYQCRTWTAWHRFTIFAMIALAVLAVALARINGEQSTLPD